MADGEAEVEGGEGQAEAQQKDAGADFRRLHNYPLIRVNDENELLCVTVNANTCNWLIQKYN